MIKDTNINYSIKRHIEEHVKECIKQYQCVVLTGPRQVGKSTLIESILPSIGNYKIVKLDSTELINYAKTDPIAFFNEYQPPVFIDEVQKAPELFNYIKELIDKHKQKSMFILTGSESFELIKGVGDTLSTRAALIDLQSLSISEINGRANFVFEPDYNKFLLRKCKQKTQLEIFKDIINGSMPDVINGSKTNLDTFYKTYIKSTLFKDIREDVLNISNFEDFLNFLSLMASLVGETLNYTSIARKVGVTPLTIKKWISALKATGVIFFINPYSNNALTRTIRSPKMYFWDTGLACYLTKFDDPDFLLKSDFAGHIFECYAISEIAKGYLNAGKMLNMFYIKTIDPNNNKNNNTNFENHKNGEIDLIIEGKGGILYPIEIKMNMTPQFKYFENIKLLSSIKNKKIAPMTLICSVPSSQTLGPNKLVLPVYWL